MKYLRRTVFLCLPLLCLIHCDIQGRESKTKDLMRKKLAHAQKLLEGIALNDYKKIDEQAEGLMDVSKAASWRVRKTPKYEVFTNMFRRNLQDIQTAAKGKNIDGVALAYVDLTLTCVKCHKHIREVRMGRLDLPAVPRALPQGSPALESAE